MPRELNYYQLLKLSPTVDDWPTIEKRINEMQPDWSQMATESSEYARRRGTANMNLVPKMRTDLRDSAIRQQHRERERQRLADLAKETPAKLDRFARVLRMRPGGCTQAVVKDIAKKLGAGWDEMKVRKELEQRGVSFAGTGAAARPVREPLDPSLATTLRGEMQFLVEEGTLQQPDLYELLGPSFGPGTSCDQLRDEAGRQEKDLRRRGGTDPVSSSRLALLGQCRTLLGDPAGKARYDNYRATQAMEPFKDHLRLGAGDAKVILPQLADEVVALAAAKGIPAKTARQFIEDFVAQTKGFTLLPRDAGAGGDPLQCGFCYEMASPDAEACRKCGKALSMTCPNPRCKTRVPTQDAYCGKCGYATGNAPLFFGWLEEGKKQLRDGHLEQARQRVEAVLRGWHGYPEAVELEKEIQRQASEYVNAERELRALLAQGRGETVRTRLVSLARAGYAVELQAAADRMIADARRLVEEGRRRQAAGDADAAIDRFEEALRICADHADARKALVACPPAPPEQLQVVLQVGAAVLEWRVSPSRGGLRYRVVRMVGSAPRRPDDGTLVDTIDGTTLTDEKVPVGEAVYYAVYTERGGAVSAAAAVDGPIFRVADVADLRALGLDRCVELTWQAPPTASRVEVWRRPDSPPDRRGDGTALPVVGKQTASDAGLAPGNRIGYRVVAVFTGPDGQPRYAPGSTTIATPVTLPKPVADLSAFRAGDEVEATWPPQAGSSDVAVCVSAQEPACKAGDVLAAGELTPLGQRLRALGPGRARGRVEAVPVLYLTPVSIAAGTAVIGKTVRLTTIEEIANLDVRLAGGRLICRWDWPPGIRSALVGWRQDRFPTGPHDRRAQRQTCERFHYDQQGRFSCAAPVEGQQLFLTVYAKAQTDDGWQFSSGMAEGTCREVPLTACHRIRYRFGPVKFLRHLFGGGDYELRLTPEAEVQLPALVLMVRSGQVPLDREDGTAVLRIAAGTACSPQDPLVEVFPAADLPRHPKGKVFLEDPNDDCLELHRDP